MIKGGRGRRHDGAAGGGLDLVGSDSGTVEHFEEVQLKVVKKDLSREPFEPEKIRKGLEKACFKRPVSTDQIARYPASMRRVPKRSASQPPGSCPNA